MTHHRSDKERAARIDLMIETLRSVEQRRLMRRAMKRFARTEDRLRAALFDAGPERVH